MKKPALWIIFGVLLAVALFSGYKLISLLSEYRQGEESYTQLARYVQIDGTDARTPDETGESTPAEESIPSVDHAGLMTVNADYVGWIYVEGTNINYPIVRGQDNDRYLNRMFDGTYNAAGSIFMDYRSAPDWSDPHTILYGHNMKNRTMFANVGNYKSQAYYDDHPTGLLLTPEGNYELQFFAGYNATTGDKAWDLAFSSQEDFSGWISQAKEKSVFSGSVIPGADDRIVTLSTCTYDRKDARFVLLAVLKPLV